METVVHEETKRNKLTLCWLMAGSLPIGFNFKKEIVCAIIFGWCLYLRLLWPWQAKTKHWALWRKKNTLQCIFVLIIDNRKCSESIFLSGSG